MAITPSILGTQARLLSVYNIPTVAIEASQARIVSVEHRTSDTVQASQARAVAAVSATRNMEVTQSRIVAVCRGRVENPQVRAFTFTLDGHDFYGLRLGDQGTILFDTYSQQWVDWTSEMDEFWRVNCAINWVDGQGAGNELGAGTDIIAGDDSWGLLYFLNPLQSYDDHPDAQNAVQQLPFPRIVMAQTTVQGRTIVPCYVIFLDTDNYGLSAIDFVPSVTLETSDDQGQTFLDHGTITVSPNTNDQDYRWYSLGQMASPGRLFRITDNGLLTRIDAMQMNDQ